MTAYDLCSKTSEKKKLHNVTNMYDIKQRNTLSIISMKIIMNAGKQHIIQIEPGLNLKSLNQFD